DLLRQYTFEPVDFNSELSTKNIAIYGQIEIPFANRFSLTSGLRLEQRRSKYNDNTNADFSPKENLWGGKISLKYNYSDKQMIYGLVSRGYKNGGFNADAGIDEEDRFYNTEFMLNYELGIKGLWLDHRLSLQASIFYQDRKNIQSKQSIVRSFESGLTIQQGGGCPCSFTDLTLNTADPTSRGIELESTFQWSDSLDIYGSLGLLDADFDSFLSFTHIGADLETVPPIPVNLNGRSVAHAPKYQAVLGAHYYFDDWLSFNLEVESKDKFFFSDRHDLKSDQYEVVNLRLNYQTEYWRISFYANNVTDKNIKTRGFGSFGNDPRTFYARGEYFQFAAPRVLGLSISKEFR
ncbi:MAG: TonB-dependent receptor, partial [Kangiellaceae bacterium]|nr:TonB-dependent receptor [Kangiellaceae bacterium]